MPTRRPPSWPAIDPGGDQTLPEVRRRGLLAGMAGMAGMAVAAPVGAAQARAATPPAAGLPVPLAGTTAHDLAAPGGGEPWRIFLHRPPGEPPPGGWPAVLLLDGNALIGLAVEALRLQTIFPQDAGLAPAVLVGIGYPTEAPYDLARRSGDYTPPPGRTYPPRDDGPAWRTGGADGFLDFVEKTLKPWLAARLPLDSGRQGLMGHSFGGLFVLHALFNRPRAFSRWAALSPSIWWEDRAILAGERRYAALPPEGRPPGRLLLGVGGYEQRLSPAQAASPTAADRRARAERGRMEDNAREMAQRLNALPGGRLAARFELYPEETHGSVLPTAVNRGLRFLLAE